MLSLAQYENACALSTLKAPQVVKVNAVPTSPKAERATSMHSLRSLRGGTSTPYQRVHRHNLGGHGWLLCSTGAAHGVWEGGGVHCTEGAHQERSWFYYRQYYLAHTLCHCVNTLTILTSRFQQLCQSDCKGGTFGAVGCLYSLSLSLVTA